MKHLAFPLFGCIPAFLLAVASTSLAQVPVNDNFAAATPVTAGVLTAGTNVNATVQSGEPPTHWTLTYAAGAATGRSVWFSYTPAASGLASFTVVAQGTGTTAVIMQGAAYSGTALNNLVRIASASSTAGGTTTAGVAFPSNLFAVTAGVPVYIQVTGASALFRLGMAAYHDRRGSHRCGHLGRHLEIRWRYHGLWNRSHSH